MDSAATAAAMPAPAADHEEASEDAAALIASFGANPLMARAQAALHRQLRRAKEKASAEAVLRAEQLRRAQKEREDIGVELYALQQQLGRQQQAVEDLQVSLQGSTAAKEQVDQQLGVAREEVKQKGSMLTEYRRLHGRTRAELDAAFEAVRMIERHVTELRSEADTTKRATYKAEGSTQALEKSKSTQDDLIDRLTVQVGRFEEQLVLLESQVAAQVSEAATASTALRDTASEMELVAFEKRQLLLQWKSSLIGLTRRDEAVAGALRALDAARSEVREMDTEVAVMRRDLAREQSSHEAMAISRDRLQAELQFVQSRVSAFQQQREVAAERFAVVQRSLQQLDGDERLIDASAKTMRTRVEQQLQQLQQVVRARQEVEERAMLRRAGQQTADKAAQATLRVAAEVQASTHRLEREAADLRNDTARSEAEAADVAIHIGQMEDVMRSASEQLQEQERLAERAQVELRQRRNETEKRMFRAERLNRKLQVLQENAQRAGDEDMRGPLEAAIHGLGQKLTEVARQSEECQQQWLQSQTQLVAVLAAAEQESERTSELDARTAVANTRRMRVESSHAALQTEVRDMRARISKQQHELARMAEQRAGGDRRVSSLREESQALELRFGDELRAMEREAAQMQTRLAAEREERVSLAGEALEAERQALLWEKKLQLEKETREALDPGGDGSGEGGPGAEIRDMEREIHRMRLRFESLKREQERLVTEVERSVNRREDIQLAAAPSRRRTTTSAGAARSGGGGSDQLSTADVSRKAYSLQREARALADEVDGVQAAAEQRRAKLSELATVRESAARQVAECGEELARSQARGSEAAFERQRLRDGVMERNKLLRILRQVTAAATAGGAASSTRSQREALRTLLAAAASAWQVRSVTEEGAMQALPQAEQQLAGVQQLLRRLSSENPRLETVFAQLGRVCSEAIV